MDVVFGHVRELVIHDVGEQIDIDPARGYISRDEHAHPTGLEVIERLGAGTLALVAMDRGSGDAVGLKIRGEPVGPVLGAGENEDLAPVVVFDEF